MYANVGEKIKRVAFGTFVVECCVAVIAAFVFLSEDMGSIVGLLLLVGGPLVAWISSFILYGFGLLVENAERQLGLPVESAATAPVSAPTHSHIKSTAQVKTTQATKAKYWTCDCGTENAANSLFCESCGASR